MFIQPELWPIDNVIPHIGSLSTTFQIEIQIEVLHCGNRDFRLFFAPVTLKLTRRPSYMKMTRIPWRYTGCANMNFLWQGFRRLSSDRQTDRHDQNYTPPVASLGVAGGGRTARVTPSRGVTPEGKIFVGKFTKRIVEKRGPTGKKGVG